MNLKKIYISKSQHHAVQEERGNEQFKGHILHLFCCQVRQSRVLRAHLSGGLDLK